MGRYWTLKANYRATDDSIVIEPETSAELTSLGKFPGLRSDFSFPNKPLISSLLIDRLKGKTSRGITASKEAFEAIKRAKGSLTDDFMELPETFQYHTQPLQ